MVVCRGWGGWVFVRVLVAVAVVVVVGGVGGVPGDVLLVVEADTAPLAVCSGATLKERVVAAGGGVLGVLGVGVQLLELGLHLRVLVENVLGDLQLGPHERVHGVVGLVAVVLKGQVLVDVHKDLRARLLRLGLDRRQQRVVPLVELVQEHVPGLKVHRAGHLVHVAEAPPQLRRRPLLAAHGPRHAVLALPAILSAAARRRASLHARLLVLLLLYRLVQLQLLRLRLQQLRGARRRARLHPHVDNNGLCRSPQT